MKRGFAALLITAGLAGVWFRHVASRDFRGFAHPVLIDIPQGSTSAQVAALLTAGGVVESPTAFWIARLIHPRRKIQAGEYRFATPASADTVLARLDKGDVHHYELRIPEGANLYEIARAAATLGFLAESDFLSAARDPSLIRDLDPAAPTLEGYLFPATYRLTRRTTAAALCRTMVARFRQEWSRIGNGKPPREFVILASLVEKETGAAPERRTVASVYRNRLRRSIRLECDPTTIYAALVEGVWDGVIHKSDLARKHPYNTYQTAGLPPGPIANPGAEALKAALDPAETNFLFFVARPGASGEHRFSSTLAEHNRAVADYRRGQKTNQASPAQRLSRRG